MCNKIRQTHFEFVGRLLINRAPHSSNESLDLLKMRVNGLTVLPSR